MKKWLIPLALLLALGAGYLALPWHSAQQLLRDARAENIGEVSERVDFPALRANLRAGLQEQMRESMGESVPGELGDWLAAGSGLFLGPLLDQLITPEGVAELLRGGGGLREFERELYRGSSPDSSGSPSAAEGEDATWQVLHWSLPGASRFAADCGEAGGEPQLRLILERQGLHWRLVDINFL